MTGNPQAFVEASAQIIPVLVLALLADPVNRTARVGQSGLILLALGAGIIGEGLALTAVVLGTDANINVIIVSSMIVLGTAILIPHVAIHFPNATSRIPMRVRIVLRSVLPPLVAALYLMVAWGALPLALSLFVALGVVGWAVDSFFEGRKRWRAMGLATAQPRATVRSRRAATSTQAHDPNGANEEAQG